MASDLKDSGHAALSLFLCLLVAPVCFFWFRAECVHADYSWRCCGILGGTLGACVLGLWANTLWVEARIGSLPEGLPAEERKALIDPLLRRLWGGFVLAFALFFAVRSAANRFLPSPPRNAVVAERRTEEILLAQAAFVAQRKSQGLEPRAAMDFNELAPWLPPELLDGEDAGYRFLRMRTYDTHGGTDPRYGFAYCAAPIRFGETGNRVIVFRHTGEWWYQHGGRGLPESDWIWADDNAMQEFGWVRYSDPEDMNAGLPEAPRDPPAR